jgi:hypothetical protein
MLFHPFYPALMLAVEAQNVIDMRLWKIATGGVHARKETQLIDAAVEASAMLMGGKTTVEVIDFYRKQVAANATRLT